MADRTLPLTHYWPWDGDEQRAVCGTPMQGDARRHSLAPSCPVCATHLAAEDDRIDAEVALTALPLDVAEVADLAPARPASPLAADLFDLALSFTRVYALGVRR